MMKIKFSKYFITEMRVYVNNKLIEGNTVYPSSFFYKGSLDIQSDTWRSSDFFYTCIIVDPDAPYPNYPINRYVLHFMVINTKEIIFSFRPPNPPYDSTYHRYFVLVFRHRKKINKPNLARTSRFDVNRFVRTHELELIDSFVFLSVKK